MTNIEMKAMEMNNDVAAVKRKLKSIASAKCRLKKMPGRSDYATEMAKIEADEKLYTAVKDFLIGPKKNVNNLTQEDIDNMDYDAVCKAIRCIQTKKSHTKWDEDCLKDEDGLCIPGSGAKYKKACEIEEALLDKKETLKPSKPWYIKRSELQKIFDEAKANSRGAKEALAMIEELIKRGDENDA